MTQPAETAVLDATVRQLVGKIPQGSTTVFDLVRELGKDGKAAAKLTVEQRRLHPEEPRHPSRKESPARRHEFLDAQSFAAYLARYGGEKTVVFADPVHGVMQAVLDEEAAAGFELLTMKPAPHPLWEPWAALLLRRLGLDVFVQFVMQNRRSIARPDGRALAMLLSQVTGKVSIEVQRGRGREAINGLVVTTKVEGKEQKDLVDIPDSIVVRVPLYVGTEARELELDLLVEAASDAELTVFVAGATVAEARVRAFEEMVETVRQGVQGRGTFALGRPDHADWAYLPELRQ